MGGAGWASGAGDEEVPGVCGPTREVDGGSGIGGDGLGRS